MRLTYEQIIDLGLKLGLEEIEIYAQTRLNNTVKVFDGELSNYNSSDIFGMSIRGLYNGKMCNVYLESLEEKDVKEMLEQLILDAKSLTSKEEEHVYPGGCKYMEVSEIEADFDKYSLTEKVEMLKKLSSDALNKSELIKKIGYCQYSEASGNIKIINSLGLNLSRNFSYMSTVLGTVASDGEKTTVGYAFDASKKFKELDLDRILEESTTSALSSLGAETIESGEYPVVLSKEVASDILTAFTSIFSGESALRKLTILTDKIGQDVFGKNITIVDDPFSPYALNKFPFDDEGVPCMTKEIVKDGKFLMFMHSLKTAAAFNTTSTGNGFKAKVSSNVKPEPSNLYLVGQNHTEAELIESVDYGIYVTEVNGLHAGLNPISGAFNVQASGFLIEKGQKTKPITLFVISGNFFELMNNVELIAHTVDKIIEGAACPALKIKKLVISGK